MLDRGGGHVPVRDDTDVIAGLWNEVDFAGDHRGTSLEHPAQHRGGRRVGGSIGVSSNVWHARYRGNSDATLLRHVPGSVHRILSRRHITCDRSWVIFPSERNVSQGLGIASRPVEESTHAYRLDDY